MKAPLIVIMILISFSACQKALKDVNDYFPKVTTLSAMVQPDGSVLVEAELDSEGAAAVEYLGFCCGTEAEPEMADRQIWAEYADGKFFAAYPPGSFHPDSTYYFRSWAANGWGYSYGNILSLDHIIAVPVDPPCAPVSNTVSIGGGQPVESYYLVGDPSVSIDSWSITAATFAGPTVDFVFHSEITTGVYKTVGHNSPGPGQAFISFYSGFISGSLAAGSDVYVKRLGPGSYEITVCDAPWDYDGSTFYFRTQLTIP